MRSTWRTPRGDLRDVEVHADNLLAFWAAIDSVVGKPPVLDYDQALHPSFTVRAYWLDVLLLRFHLSSILSGADLTSNGWSVISDRLQVPVITKYSVRVGIIAVSMGEYNTNASRSLSCSRY